MGSFFFRTFTFVSILLALPLSAGADALIISPANAAYTTGKSFSVRINASAIPQAINAVSGNLSFPQDKLQVVSISKEGSILTLWVQEPTFSNTQGKISFEGVVPNPGFQGSSGRILTVNFRAVGKGVADINFDSGALLANDGLGTNILRTITGSTITIGGSPVPAFPDPVTTEADPRAPEAPMVVSAEFPDPMLWYAKTGGNFSWDVPGDVTGVRLLLNKLPIYTPTFPYEPAIASKEIADLGDGIWYFHVQLKNSYGWGGVTHRPIRVDTTKPDTFDVRELVRSDMTDPRIRFSMSATDGMSGIRHYSIEIDRAEPIIWRDDGTGIYMTEPLGPGKHSLIARAYDEAGNYAVASEDFEIVGIPTPVIASYTEVVTAADPLIVEGTAISNATVRLILRKNGQDPIVATAKASASGSFSALFDEEIPRGIYRLTAVAVDSRGAESEPSDEKTVIARTGWLAWLGVSILSILAIAVPILALLVLLVYLILHVVKKIRKFRKDVKRELDEVEDIVKKSFELLKEDIEESMHMLEKAELQRTLTAEEQAILKRFEDNLDITEKVINKELGDVKREMGEK